MTVRSLYEQLFPLSKVMGQRVVDNCSGDEINERWTINHTAGTGTKGIVDGIDEGIFIKCGPDTANDRSAINFNDKRQYSQTASVILMVAKRVDTLFSAKLGMFNRGASPQDNSSVYFQEFSGNTFVKYWTVTNALGSTNTDTITVNTNFHFYKSEQLSSSCEGTIDNTLEATHTSQLPDLKLQPAFDAQSVTSAGARELRIRYVEAYNT